MATNPYGNNPEKGPYGTATGGGAGVLMSSKNKSKEEEGGGGGQQERGNLLTDRWGQLSEGQQSNFAGKKDYNKARRGYENAQETGANTSVRSRMAGEKLNDARNVARAARQAGEEVDAKTMAKIQRNEDRIYGNIDKFDASAAGAGQSRGTNRISRRDMKELRQRHGDQAVIDLVQNDKSGALIGGKAQAFLDKMIAKNGGTPGEEDSKVGINPPKKGEKPGNQKPGNQNPGNQNPGNQNPGAPAPGNQAGPGTTGPANQTVKNNNQTTQTNNASVGTVSGNNNTIDQSITDNSDKSTFQIGRGGDRVMNINSTGGTGGVAGAVDGVATAGTLGGMWDVDDSMAAQGKMIAGYSAVNEQMQKPYQGAGGTIANQYIQNAAATNPLDYEKLDQQIQNRQIYHQDQAILQENKTMGDSWKFTPSDYKMPQTLKNEDFSEHLDDASDKAYDEIGSL